jgi:type I restriction enzyme R subunit
LATKNLARTVIEGGRRGSYKVECYDETVRERSATRAFIATARRSPASMRPGRALSGLSASAVRCSGGEAGTIVARNLWLPSPRSPGETDRPLEAIRRYRNERNPNIAVTVDLLTTGIDVPRIANLVFLRRVGSRILYEQMIGRATRLCPETSKERFRIFDAVGLYDALKDVTDMKPVVVNPLVTFEQLVKEVLEGKEEELRRTSLDELLAKLHRKKRALTGEVEEQFQAAAGMTVRELAALLKKSSVGDAADYLKNHPALAPFLDRASGGGGYKLVVSERHDEVREVTHGYGKEGNRRPDDYLEAFRKFVAGNANKLPALLVVTQRPRDLTREELRKLKLALDQEGFSEKSVQSAWRDQKNEDIAATIVG